jgi:N-acetylglucosamine-6-phosphate deacetylase
VIPLNWAPLRGHSSGIAQVELDNARVRVIEDGVVVIEGGKIIQAGNYADVVAAARDRGYDQDRTSGGLDLTSSGDLDPTSSDGPSSSTPPHSDTRSDQLLQAVLDARTWNGLILPGLVDIHCHGGGGQSFPDAKTTSQAMTAIKEHRQFGTTTLVASLVTDTAETLLRQTKLLTELCTEGELDGIHLEGPFLSVHRAGAQDPAKMLTPNPGLVYRVAKAAKGWFTAMTLAPELAGVVSPLSPVGATSQASDKDDADPQDSRTGAGNVVDGIGQTCFLDDLDTAVQANLEHDFGIAVERGETASVIAALVAHGVVPSFGHTDCSASQMAKAVGFTNFLFELAEGAGARSATATHLFNGMRPIHHRDPGPAMEALAQAAAGEMVAELIADGVHIAADMVRDVFQTAGADNVALVTDAMAAAGMADGQYQLGPMAVTVADGAARLTGQDSLAGGTAHLIETVRFAWRDCGVPLSQAVTAASLTPARVLGRVQTIGALAPGRDADLLLVDNDLNPVEVYRKGLRLQTTPDGPTV